MNARGRKHKHRKLMILGRLVILSIFVLMLFNGSGGFVSASKLAQADGLVVEDLTATTLTPTDLVNHLVGPGETVSNVGYTGDNMAAGKFSGGIGIIGFGAGIVLGTGSVADVVGPNNDGSISTRHTLAGDADLDAIYAHATKRTNDAAVLEFSFIPAGDTLSFRYVFASEEYNENLDKAYGDDFIGFFVDGQNCATVNGDLVSVNTINNGDPHRPNIVPSHPDLYIDNLAPTLNTQMDGLTVVLTCNASITRGVVTTIKLAIGDGTDFVGDSNVFLESGSFNSTPPRHQLPR